MGFSLGKLFKKRESLLSIDIGSTSIKLLELDNTGEKPRLITFGQALLSGEVFANNIISEIEPIAEKIVELVEEHQVGDRRVSIAMPGPSVFTKRVKLQKVPLSEFDENVYMEASNFIPHDIDAVKLDYHIIGESGKDLLDVLVVAVKNEIVESYIECLGAAGLETAVVDIDYFALQNMFELSYPELTDKTTALINMGARYSSINICRGEDSLFTGDIPVGGRTLSESISEKLGLPLDQAEQLKIGHWAGHPQAEVIQDAIEKNVEYVASEINRQLSFFWSASGTEEGIDKIMLVGGAALVPNLTEELENKTGISCELADPFRGVEIDQAINAQQLKGLKPFLGVALGMGIREPGDKIIPEFMDYA